MAQHDYDISNQSFPAFRSDLNSVLEAINTSNSGTSRPTSAVAGTVWLDTTNATNPTLKLYDGNDDISLATFDYSANTVNWLDSTVSADLVNDLSPQLGGMLDVNGNAIGNGTEELIKFSETSSAVNEITVTNSATGNAPEISATGDDTNIDFKLTPKGTGKLILDGLNFPTADGTTGQFLKTDGSGNLSFDDAAGGVNTPNFYVQLGSSQSIPDATVTKIQLNSEDFDTASAFDNSTNYRFTVPSGQAGKYFITFGVSRAGWGSNRLIAELHKNGSGVATAEDESSGINDYGTANSSVILDLSVGDYLELTGFQNTGSSQNIYGGITRRTYMGGFKIIE